jgi:hypothetical protein
MGGNSAGTNVKERSTMPAIAQLMTRSNDSANRRALRLFAAASQMYWTAFARRLIRIMPMWWCALRRTVGVTCSRSAGMTASRQG